MELWYLRKILEVKKKKEYSILKYLTHEIFTHEGNDNMELHQEEEQLLSLIRELCNRLSAQVNHIYAPYGLTAIQFEILTELYLEKQLSMSLLAKRLAMTNSNLSAIVKRLEQHHFVCRTRDPNDQRTVLVNLSEEAIVLLEKMRSESCSHAHILKEVSKQDREDILKGLHKLNLILKECDSYE